MPRWSTIPRRNLQRFPYRVTCTFSIPVVNICKWLWLAGWRYGLMYQMVSPGGASVSTLQTLLRFSGSWEHVCPSNFQTGHNGHHAYVTSGHSDAPSEAVLYTNAQGRCALRNCSRGFKMPFCILCRMSLLGAPPASSSNFSQRHEGISPRWIRPSVLVVEWNGLRAWYWPRGGVVPECAWRAAGNFVAKRSPNSRWGSLAAGYGCIERTRLL